MLLQSAHFLADAVDDYAPQAVGAHQSFVVLTLEARLSDDVSRAQFHIGGFHLFGAHFADVTAGVRQEAVARIPAAVDHEHFEYRNVGPMRFYESDVGVTCFRLDHDRLEFRHGLCRIDHLLQFVKRHAQAIGDLRE